MDQAAEAMEQGLAIQELQRSEGWVLLEGKIRSEIESAMQEQRQIELSGRNLQEIATDYISITQKINGLSRVLEMVNEYLERMSRYQ